MLNGAKTVIKHEIRLLNLAEELGNLSKACRITGLSRDTFYRYQNAVEQGGNAVYLNQIVSWSSSSTSRQDRFGKHRFQRAMALY